MPGKAAQASAKQAASHLILLVMVLQARNDNNAMKLHRK